MSTKKLQIIGGSILQPNWNETDPDSPSYIKGRPNIPSDFDGSYDKLTGLPDLSNIQYKGFINSVTLSADGWSEESPYFQNLEVNGITLNSKIDIQADADTFDIILNNGYSLFAKNDKGVATIYSIGSKPMTDIVIQLNISEVSKPNESDVIWGNSLSCSTRNGGGGSDKISYGTTDLSSGVSSLESGMVYLVYE